VSSQRPCLLISSPWRLGFWHEFRKTQSFRPQHRGCHELEVFGSQFKERLGPSHPVEQVSLSSQPRHKTI
jgi:hypothetical protein